MKQEIKIIIEKGNFSLIDNDTHISGNPKHLTTQETQTAKKHKEEIIEYLISQRQQKEEREKIEEEKRQQEYDILKAQLSPIPEFKNTPNEEKFQELKAKANAIHYYSGAESDGLNLAVDSQKSEIMKEARKYCKHNIEINYNYTYTHDARKLITRIIKCEKCGLYQKDGASEELSPEAIWR